MIAVAAIIMQADILLDGHFAGRMVTRMHCLEIAMPVGATLPSTPLLEVLRAVKDANRAVEAESFQQRAKVVESLLAVVEADVDPALRATEERSDPTITPAEPAGEAVPKYEDMSKELEILRSQSSRMQQETEQLRIKNAALVNFLSSAERSAAKLRAALTDAGITPVLSPDTSPKTTRAGQPPPPDLQADIQEPCATCRVMATALAVLVVSLRGTVVLARLSNAAVREALQMLIYRWRSTLVITATPCFLILRRHRQQLLKDFPASPLQLGLSQACLQLASNLRPFPPLFWVSAASMALLTLQALETVGLWALTNGTRVRRSLVAASLLVLLAAKSGQANSGFGGCGPFGDTVCA
eukprot:s298_g7.t1